LALAWPLAKKDYIVPIRGSRNPDRVAQNIAAGNVTLTADDLACINEIAPKGGIGGRQGKRAHHVPDVRGVGPQADAHLSR